MTTLLNPTGLTLLTGLFYQDILNMDRRFTFMHTRMCFILILAIFSSAAGFYEDFSDNDISDWHVSCLFGKWVAIDSMAQALHTASCAALLAPEWVEFEDCVVTTRTRAVHVCGVAARMHDPNNGVCAYVSPDHDVARIRRISNGNVSTKYKSIYHDFPSDVWYNLTFTCSGDSLIFLIEVTSTGQQWEFSAIDPYPASGRVGLMAGDEYHAYWDWFQAIPEVGIAEDTNPGCDEFSVSVRPNPFYSIITFNLTGISDDVTLHIYDISGHLVRSIEAIYQDTSSSAVVWDGVDDSGNHAPSGVYFVKPNHIGSSSVSLRIIKAD